MNDTGPFLRFLIAVTIALATMSCATDTEEPNATPSPATEPIQAATPSAATEGDVSEDGRHAVYIKSVDTDERTISVDAIAWLTGDEAEDAFYEETGERGGPPNDYFIENEKTEEQTLEVDEDAEIQVTALDPEGEPDAVDLESATFEQLEGYIGEREGSSPFWVEVEGGVVVDIEEQYVP